MNYVADNPVFYVWYPLFLFLLGTGCRIGEAIASATGLTDGDVRKILNELKNSNNITYSRKAYGWVLISN